MPDTDIAIIGAGPAGCAAAIYVTRSGLKPVVFGGAMPGGQLLLTHEIENFPGFPEPVAGAELMERMLKQCKRLGAQVLTDEVAAVDFSKHPLTLESSSGETYRAKAVIVATGAKARWLGIESEKKFMGRGVSACATCDGFFYRGKEVCVVGGGDTAVGDALFLTRFAEKIYLIHRRDALRASTVLAAKAKKNPKIVSIWNSAVQEVTGSDYVEGVKLRNVKTGEVSSLACSGVFVAIGHDPRTKMFLGQLKLDEAGYIATDSRMRTSVQGVFAAGDVADHDYQQAVTSVGSGCKAALEAERYLQTLP